MRAVTFINRFLIIGITLIFIVGLVVDEEAFILGLLSGIPLGVFQVIASLILLSYRDTMVKVLKMSLNVYYLLVVFYFLLFNMMLTHTGIQASEEILIVIPVILAIGLTVIIELTYKEIKQII